MATALKLVKESLGPEALILSTRSVRNGKGGLLGKPMLEVTAAIESPEPAPRPVVPPSAAANLYGRALGAAPASEPIPAEPEVNYADLWRRRKVIDPLEQELDALKGQVSSLNVDSLRSEINELKELVKDAVGGRAAPSVSAPASRPGQPAIVRMMEDLLARGLNEAVAEVIVKRALRNYPPKDRSITLEAFLAAAMIDLIRVSRPLAPGRGPRVLALIGPTGVGKTTTVAKLAADFLLNQGRKIALVTIDIYRIAAAEQLKVYGEIMQLPVDVVLSDRKSVV